MASTSETRLAYIAETAYGTTPSSPTWQELRFNSESLVPNIENVQSDEIRSDRNVSDLIQVGSSAGGDINFELSYGTFDDFLESLMYSTWDSNVLVNGTTEKSFTLEKTFEMGATDQYHRFTGAICNTLSLSLATRSIVTGNFGFVAAGASSAQAEIASSTYTGVNSNPVINASSNFASLALAGVTGPEATAININITNNITSEDVLGSLDARGQTAGQFVVTGDITLYFENEELYELFLAGTASSLSFEVGGASTLKYAFDIANLKFNDVSVVAGGNNQPLLVEASFTGIYDSDISGAIEITRTPS